MKDCTTYQNKECTVQFLMGLNESYTQIRAQILIMDHVPTISKIFALVTQEEKQRSIHNDFSSSSTDRTVVQSSNVTAVRGSSIGKDYQVHGYPPGHPKHKHKPLDSKVHANQVQSRASSTIDTDRVDPTVGDKLSPDQCKQLIAFLSSQLQLDYGKPSDSSQLDPYVSCFSGIFSSSLGFPSILDNDWVLDTGATHHIRFSLALFYTYHPTKSYVALPNNSHISATHVGSVCLSPDFILQNVLFCRGLYYSYEMDITLNLQRRFKLAEGWMSKPIWKQGDPRFVWNWNVLEEFIENRVTLDKNHLGLSLCGEMKLNNSPAVIKSIARRCTRRLGSRIWRKVANLEGDVAYFIETERLLELEGYKSSFLQVRGSIPLLWEQIVDLSYKPRFNIINHEQTQCDEGL